MRDKTNYNDVFRFANKVAEKISGFVLSNSRIETVYIISPGALFKVTPAKNGVNIQKVSSFFQLLKYD